MGSRFQPHGKRARLDAAIAVQESQRRFEANRATPKQCGYIRGLLKKTGFDTVTVQEAHCAIGADRLWIGGTVDLWLSETDKAGARAVIQKLQERMGNAEATR